MLGVGKGGPAMHPKTIDASPRLLLQFLEWVAARPRDYHETMDAWRTSCPRISVWEDALIAGYVAAEDSPDRAQGPQRAQNNVRIVLTPAGVDHLDQSRNVAAVRHDFV
jgi:hypothetical protein